MTKTLENLTKAFIGESQARNRYTFYSKIAKKEGYEKVAGIFALTAEQEKEHAHWHFKLIQKLKEKEGIDDDEFTVDAAAPTVMGDTITNLKAAIAGENYETSEMYPEFADIAQEEGYPKIAVRLRAIAKAEQNHENRYQGLLKLLEDDKMFKDDEEVAWVCRECGYVHYGKNAPKICPSCDHSQAYYERSSIK